MASKRMVVFSGIQPTGIPHLGNYIGAIQQWVRLQDELPSQSKLFFSVVDLHAMTAPKHRADLRRRKRETLAALLAVGIDPARSAVFYQSSVPAHSELMWILSCTASVGYLSRMTQWKSKLSLSPTASLADEKSKSSLKLGLFSYPVLQAADILVHGATHVPVGDDQRQHLEFARECVTNFNSTFGAHLVPPETLTANTPRIMSLQQPEHKMSKSHSDPRSRILLTDTPDVIQEKVLSALTDSQNFISYEPKRRPGVSNLINILSCFDKQQRGVETLASVLAQSSLRDLKMGVAEAVIQALGGIRERFLEFMAIDDGRYLDSVEHDGAKKARLNAEETMHIVRKATGL